MRWILALFLALLPVSALAQERFSHCIAVADAAPGIDYVQPASWADPLPDDDTVRLHYIDHSMFLIQTPGGISAVTDYNGYLGEADFAPDLVLMNGVHDGHWTNAPDPRIGTVLRGWGDGETPARHRLSMGDMLVRNIPTDTFSRRNGFTRHGNSIFVFEVAGLCIGHLGHLHYALDEAQLAALGRLDVVMAPVDGSMTLDLPSLFETLGRLRSSVVIPMHWFGRTFLEDFLTEASETFAIDRRDSSELEISLATLPERPTIVVLSPSLLEPE